MPFTWLTTETTTDNFLSKALDFTMRWPQGYKYWKILPDSAPSLNLEK
jgi:hypothetical protein